MLKDVVFQLLPFKIYNYFFFCLKCNRMVCKCKLCNRIFIRDIDHARKIEVTNKRTEGTSIYMLMNEINAKSVVLNLYYLVGDFSLAGKFGKLFAEIANHSFGPHILFLQIYYRVFFNALSDVINIVTENYCLSMKLKSHWKSLANDLWYTIIMLLSARFKALSFL